MSGSIFVPSGSASARPTAAPGLAEQLLVLRRRWRVVFGTTGLVIFITCLLLGPMSARYTATGVLLYDPQNALAAGGDPAAPPVGQLNEAAVTASQIEVIDSLPAAAALADRLHLAQRPEFNPALRHSLLGSRAVDPAAVVARVRRALDVSVVPDSRVMTVSFTSDNAAVATEAANIAMQLYLDHERDQEFTQLTDTRDWLETNAAVLQTGLDKDESALAAARAAAGVVPGAEASLTSETASRIAASLVEAEADLAMNQARLDSASHGQSAAADAAIAPNLLPLRKDQADLAAEVQSLSGEYGPDYPKLRDARASLAAISAEINAETEREMNAAQGDVAADEAEIATLKSALAAARTQSQTEDASSAPMRALEQRADAGRDMLRQMTLQADQLAQAASLVRPDARILSAAVQPESSSSPHRSLLLAAGALLGLSLGVLLAALDEALDSSFRSGDAVVENTGLPCLALLPDVRDPRMIVLDAPLSVFAEQIRALRASLSLAMQGGGPRIIAITAARPGEGKTTLTIALARALAGSGMRVVAVEGDIRQPRFEPAFCSGGAKGLTDHLAGHATLDEIIERDPRSELDVIAAGAQAATALSLFLSPAMPILLNKLRIRYDVVLLDVPPAFALAESRVLARYADAALICIRWGSTPRRVVNAALAALRAAEVKLLGAVLTRVDATAHGRAGFADSEIYQPRYAGYFRN